MFMALAVIVVAVAWAASGCGGGGDSKSLSAAAFTKQSNQICAQARAKVEGEARAISAELDASSGDGLGSYVTHFLNPWVGTAMSEIGDLGPPKKDAKQAEEMIASYEATLAKIEAEPDLALSKDPFAAPNKMATELGLHDCVI